MTFDKLVMENFGPYKGIQSLTFPSSGPKVVMIFGENFRGKTSILNAFRWVLYGEAIDRAKKKIDLVRLLNIEALSLGSTKVSVTLDLTISGHSYTLRRMATPYPGIGIPKNEKDMDISFSMLRDGAVIPSQSIYDELNRVLPKEISRFCLFDGELLKEYEALLSDSKGEARTIRDSIEQVLGVPSLVNGAIELKTLEKDARKEQSSTKKQVKAVEDQTRHLKNLIAECSKLSIELDTLKNKKNDFQAKISMADEYLDNRAIALKRNGEKEALENRLADLLEDRKVKLSLIKDSLADAWIDVLQPRISASIGALETKRKHLTGQLRRQGALEKELSQLKLLTDHRNCPVCSQDISDEKRSEFYKALGKLEVQLESLSDSSDELSLIDARLVASRDLSATGALANAAGYEADLARLDIEETEIEDKLKELIDDLKGFDPDEATRQDVRKTGFTKELGKVEQSIERISNEFEEKETQSKQLSGLLSRDPQARSLRVNLLAGVVTSLAECFKGAIGILRDNLREKVSANATRVFLELTTEKNYASLEINDNYGLNIITKDGKVVDLRSAGAEQIVALSLIAGLNSISEMGLPMVMDTPLGRLDISHRDNVLACIPTIAPQVILLAHSGEIKPDEDMAEIESSISARYRIRRITESHSQLDRIS